jgi:hypothetical protein
MVKTRKRKTSSKPFVTRKMVQKPALFVGGERISFDDKELEFGDENGFTPLFSDVLNVYPSTKDELLEVLEGLTWLVKELK